MCSGRQTQTAGESVETWVVMTHVLVFATSGCDRLKARGIEAGKQSVAIQLSISGVMTGCDNALMRSPSRC
jgi:hypothetical protein